MLITDTVCYQNVAVKNSKKIVANVFLKKNLKFIFFFSMFTARSRAAIRLVLQNTPDSFSFIEPCKTWTVWTLTTQVLCVLFEFVFLEIDIDLLMIADERSMLFSPTVQFSSALFVLMVHKSEVAWTKLFYSRFLLGLGAKYKRKFLVFSFRVTWL